MAAFLYVAVDAGGRERKGVLEGDTARHVRQLLREQALLPVSVRLRKLSVPATGAVLSTITLIALLVALLPAGSVTTARNW